MSDAINTFKTGVNLFKRGLDARKFAKSLRAQRKKILAGNRGIPSNALSATNTGGASPMSNLPHHNISIREVFRAVNGSYVPGDYKLELKVTPYKWLSTSPYSPLITIYEKMRINSYTISIYIPVISPTARASSASWLARDSTAITGIASYEQILEQPGHKRGRGATRFIFKWRPIEPSDYEYLPIALAFDNRDWGTILYSVIGAISEFPEVTNPIIEFKASFSFANLVHPSLLGIGQPRAAKPDSDDEIEIVGNPSEEIEFLTRELEKLKCLRSARASVALPPRN